MSEDYAFTRKKLAVDRARRIRRVAYIFVGGALPVFIGYFAGDLVAGFAVGVLLAGSAHFLL